MSFSFTAAIGAHSITKEVAGFFLYVFPKDKSLFLLSLVIDFFSCYSLK